MCEVNKVDEVDIHDKETAIQKIWKKPEENKDKKAKIDINSQVTVVGGLPNIVHQQEETGGKVDEVIEIIAEEPTQSPEAEVTVREMRLCDPKTPIGELLERQREETINKHLTKEEIAELSKRFGR